MPRVIKDSGNRMDFIFESDDWRKELEKWLGWSNKVVFMHADGRRVIMNQSSGTRRDDQWYSNTYAADFLSPRTSYSGYSRYGGYGHGWGDDCETSGYWSRDGDGSYSRKEFKKKYDDDKTPPFTPTVVKNDDTERSESKIGNDSNNPAYECGVCHLCMDAAWKKCKGCNQFVCRNCKHDGLCFSCMSMADVEITKDLNPLTPGAGKTVATDEDGNAIDLDPLPTTLTCKGICGGGNACMRTTARHIAGLGQHVCRHLSCTSCTVGAMMGDKNEEKDMQVGKVLYMGGGDK